jgi:SAM-dependent methyltransferase
MNASSGKASHGFDWEAAWAPYDEDTYEAALAFLRPDDVVLDIGAGDLRFARRAAENVRQVIAIERNAEILPSSLTRSPTVPQGERGGAKRRGEGHLEVIQADALTVPFPPGVTAAVLLMRHCRHFREFVAKLRAIGCERLITNARWGMGVEQISLTQPRAPFESAVSTWYACECGSVGFAPGPAEGIDERSLSNVVEVSECPKCSMT